MYYHTSACICRRLPASAEDCLHLPETVCICRRLSASAGDYLHLPETVCICRRLPASAGDCLHLPKTTGTHQYSPETAGMYQSHLPFVICHLSFAEVCQSVPETLEINRSYYLQERNRWGAGWWHFPKGPLPTAISRGPHHIDEK